MDIVNLHLPGAIWLDRKYVIQIKNQIGARFLPVVYDSRDELQHSESKYFPKFKNFYYTKQELNHILLTWIDADGFLVQTYVSLPIGIFDAFKFQSLCIEFYGVFIRNGNEFELKFVDRVYGTTTMCVIDCEKKGNPKL